MPDLFDSPGPGGVSRASAAEPAARRRGRPKGALGKKSGDLKAILVHTYDGRTPGQQLAEFCMPTAREVKACRAEAKALGLSPGVLAQMRKAKVVAKELSISPDQAYAMMLTANRELLPYVHQRLPQAEAPREGAPLPLIVLPDGPDAVAALPMAALSEDVEFQGLNDLVPAQLSRPNSHD
ncbi:hypothetical protein [Caulobacter sp. BK020]|uniref:hypothetical protein n=1 Tax=Caulobacter sp. BK020 TaxID=2512117 RepID=UPI001048DF5A|nr:hypothetical protein [Caulobacter sp. BK020]TCS14556.1 hypothetical protein EV278_107205 [Caulobacter sp. BK020]